MEISKDDTIFTIIDNISLNGNGGDNIENIIKVENTDVWSEDNYYNFVNIMNSEGYIEVSEPQTLHAYSDDYLLTIKSAKKILYYSQHNNYKYDANLISWYNHNIVSKNVVNMLFNSTLTFLNIRKIKIDTETPPVANWDNMRKYFKINKCITYTDAATNIKYIVNITKSLDRDHYEKNDTDYHLTLNKAKIINKTQKYEFYIDITNTDKDNIIPAIIKMEQALHLNSFIISKNQQAEVIKDYGSLVKNDIYTRRYDEKKPPLLTPKPFTLERMNMLNPSDYENGYGITSILSEYTVTEKADGERLLMYINNEGGVYLINNSHQVIDTGLKSPSELYNSLIDGEYIICNKRKDNSLGGISFPTQLLSFSSFVSTPSVISNFPISNMQLIGHSEIYRLLVQRSKSKKSDERYLNIVKFLNFCPIFGISLFKILRFTLLYTQSIDLTTPY
jgi:hypothetical protein